MLEATLAALEAIDTPGGVVELPFRWPEPRGKAITTPRVPPPIASYLTRRPWLLPKLFARDIPAHEAGDGAD